jgi:large subunit ribosomal protein L3
LRVDLENNLLLIKGALPGATGSNVVVRPATKAKG